jgi:recombinational DNA repair ATPase RecF
MTKSLSETIKMRSAMNEVVFTESEIGRQVGLYYKSDSKFDEIMQSIKNIAKTQCQGKLTLKCIDNGLAEAGVSVAKTRKIQQALEAKARRISVR